MWAGLSDFFRRIEHGMGKTMLQWQSLQTLPRPRDRETNSHSGKSGGQPVPAADCRQREGASALWNSLGWFGSSTQSWANLQTNWNGRHSEEQLASTPENCHGHENTVIDLIAVIISQCTHILHYHILHLKKFAEWKALWKTKERMQNCPRAEETTGTWLAAMWPPGLGPGRERRQEGKK